MARNVNPRPNKMVRNVNPRPNKMVRPSFPPLAQMFTGPVLYSTTSNEELYDDFTDAELTSQILEAARKANVSVFGVLKEYDRDISEGRSVRK